MDNHSSLFEEVSTLETTLKKFLMKEEIYWKQRYRVNWLEAGDRNMTFFHKSASTRHKRNSIRGLCNEDNQLQTDQKAMDEIVIKYYSNLFSSLNPSLEEIRKVTVLMQHPPTNNLNEVLNEPFTKEDIRKVLFDLNPSKAPRPDGLTALFFQNGWDIFGDEISSAISKVLNDGESLSQWNSTVVTLIPKNKDPSHMKDFRPISLCNVKYKIAARAIINRLKKIKDSIIDPH